MLQHRNDHDLWNMSDDDRNQVTLFNVHSRHLNRCPLLMKDIISWVRHAYSSKNIGDTWSFEISKFQGHKCLHLGLTTIPEPIKVLKESCLNLSTHQFPDKTMAVTWCSSDKEIFANVVTLERVLFLQLSKTARFKKKKRRERIYERCILWISIFELRHALSKVEPRHVRLNLQKVICHFWKPSQIFPTSHLSALMTSLFFNCMLVYKVAKHLS